MTQLRSIQKEKHICVYSKERVGVDAYVWLHQAKLVSSVDIVCHNDYSKFLSIIQAKLDAYLKFNVNLILVFEGDKLKAKHKKSKEREEIKQKTLEKAKELLASGNKSGAQGLLEQVLDVTPSMAYRALKLVKDRGIECIVAPFEADAQLAYLSKINYIHAVITEDSDLLAFGTQRVMFRTESDRTGQEILFEELEKCQELNLKGWTHEDFLFCCLFAGCDLITALKPIGFKKAFEIFDACNRDCLKVAQSLAERCPSKEEYQRELLIAYLTFKFEKVWCPSQKKIVHFTDVDLEGIRNGFSSLEEYKASLASLQQKYPFEGWNEALLRRIWDLEDFEFLGSHIHPKIARDICEGRTDPITKVDFEDEVDFSGTGAQFSFLSERHSSSSKWTTALPNAEKVAESPYAQVQRKKETGVIVLKEPNEKLVFSSSSVGDKAPKQPSLFQLVQGLGPNQEKSRTTSFCNNAQKPIFDQNPTNSVLNGGRMDQDMGTIGSFLSLARQCKDSSHIMEILKAQNKKKANAGDDFAGHEGNVTQNEKKDLAEWEEAFGREKELTGKGVFDNDSMQQASLTRKTRQKALENCQKSSKMPKNQKQKPLFSSEKPLKANPVHDSQTVLASAQGQIESLKFKQPDHFEEPHSPPLTFELSQPDKGTSYQIMEEELLVSSKRALDGGNTTRNELLLSGLGIPNGLKNTKMDIENEKEHLKIKTPSFSEEKNPNFSRENPTQFKPLRFFTNGQLDPKIFRIEKNFTQRILSSFQKRALRSQYLA